MLNCVVILQSSSNQTCPGDTITYTCITDTGELTWRENNQAQVLLTIDNHPPQQLDVFTVNLTNISGMVIVSTATINDVLIHHNGTVLTCSDNDIPQLADKTSKTVIILGMNCVGIYIHFDEESYIFVGEPSPPLNLIFTCSHSIFSVTISWVAPLDTPLCVHSYTVTVRNSCNSSQVMVYNTIDNRSSLSITDLTSDSEYSVTVAGRDGAGRLGQESEKLKCKL